MTSYLRPRSLEEATVARAAYPDWMVLAGGTDLMVNANHKPTPEGILDLWRLGELGFIRVEDTAIVIGAGTTWHEVERHPAIRDKLLPLALAAREIGALQIQARGTLGGNVGTSSPVGDSLPVLLALDATIEVASVRGHRTIPYHAYCTGYRKTQLAADDQLVGDTVTGARVALGAVADRPIRITEVELAVAGLPLAQAADAARAAMRGAIKPIDDVRSTADYRRDVAENLVARFFTS